MRAFEVQLNGKRLCLAGVGERGVLTAIIEHIAGLNGSNLNLNVGGLFSSTWKHVRWRNRRLKVGDEILIKIVESESVDKPRDSYRLDREADEKKQKAYVRAMAERSDGASIRALPANAYPASPRRP